MVILNFNTAKHTCNKLCSIRQVVPPKIRREERRVGGKEGQLREGGMEKRETERRVGGLVCGWLSRLLGCWRWVDGWMERGMDGWMDGERSEGRREDRGIERREDGETRQIEETVL